MPFFRWFPKKNPRVDGFLISNKTVCLIRLWKKLKIHLEAVQRYFEKHRFHKYVQDQGQRFRKDRFYQRQD